MQLHYLLVPRCHVIKYFHIFVFVVYIKYHHAMKKANGNNCGQIILQLKKQSGAYRIKL